MSAGLRGVAAGVARAAGVALLAALLGACTTVRIAYNNADTVVRFMATDYVDLDAAQNGDFKARLARFHDWHRSHELPAYVALLDAGRHRMAKGLSPADVEWAAGELRARYRRLAAHAAAEAAPVLATLSPGQIIVMERKLAEANAKYAAEHHLDDERKRQRKHIKQMKKRFEDWVGDLDEAQEARIERFVLAHDGLAALRLQDRARRQREAVQLIRGERDPALLAPRLAELFVQPEVGRSTEHKAALARYEAELAALVVAIDRSATPGQRARAISRMEGYAADFRVLAGQNALAKAP